MGPWVHSAPYLPCPNTGTLIPLTKALTRCSFGQATCHERSDGSHRLLNLAYSDPALIGFNKKIYLAVVMSEYKCDCVNGGEDGKYYLMMKVCVYCGGVM